MAKTRIERDLGNLRKVFRKRMEWLARSHRGCKTARGCGCSVDRVLGLLEKIEMDIFHIELEELSGHTEQAVLEIADKTKAGRGAISGKS